MLVGNSETKEQRMIADAFNFDDSEVIVEGSEVLVDEPSPVVVVHVNTTARMLPSRFGDQRQPKKRIANDANSENDDFQFDRKVLENAPLYLLLFAVFFFSLSLFFSFFALLSF